MCPCPFAWTHWYQTHYGHGYGVLPIHLPPFCCAPAHAQGVYLYACAKAELEHLPVFFFRNRATRLWISKFRKSCIGVAPGLAAEAAAADICPGSLPLLSQRKPNHPLTSFWISIPEVRRQANLKGRRGYSKNCTS